MACKLIIAGPKRNDAKLGQQGSWRGHVTYFWNFGPPPYLRTCWS